ncbi:MFS transporter [Candidatus Bathyarchaeota archaeon]|nr:MFS transporter [Candidatus Bathyarchaeota archaeon]
MEEGKRRIYSGPILILGINQLIETVAFGIPYSYFPLYALSLGASVALIGLFTSSFMLMSMILSPILGGYSDRFGRKLVIALGGIPYRLSGVMIPLSPSLSLASAFYSVRGFMWSVYGVGLRALRADLAPPEMRGRLFGLYRTFLDAGDIIGPVMASWLYDHYRFESFKIGGLTAPGYGVPFYINSIIGLVTLSILLIFVSGSHGFPQPQRRRGGRDGRMRHNDAPYYNQIILYPRREILKCLGLEDYDFIFPYIVTTLPRICSPLLFQAFALRLDESELEGGEMDRQSY